jgi:GntR family carbon starvation induced transcriptional regulator
VKRDFATVTTDLSALVGNEVSLDASRATTATAVYQRIKDDILDGRLAPGLKLRIEFLSARYGTGSSPIREALNRLSSEGIVIRYEQRGFCVAPISLDELREITTTRCWLETIALRETIANASPQWEDALVVAYHRLSRTNRFLIDADSTLNPAWEEQHAIFHEALIANCGSSLLRRYCRDLPEQSYRYRMLAAPSKPPGGEIEHQAIFEATIGKDVERAVELLNSHYRITQTISEQHLSNLTGKPASSK